MTLIEGGQYDKRWPWVHMTPEEAIQAHLERALQKAKEANVKLITPKIGETVPLIGEFSFPFSSWWKI